MKKTALLTGMATLLVSGLLFFTGCPTTVTPSVPGTGTVTVGFGDQIFRTILPETDIDDFDRFILVFTPSSYCTVFPANPDYTATLGALTGPATSPITLNEGRWDLSVTAYINDGVAYLLAAQGVFDDPLLDYILVTAGANATASVHLIPIIAGSGTFSWTIGFDASITAAFMRIYGTGVPTAFENFDLFAQPVSTTPVSWPAGTFQVFVDLENGNGEAPTIGPIVMRVYQNLESIFAHNFTFADFPRTLFDMVMTAWGYTVTGEWNFTAAGITAIHFDLLDIEVDSTLAALTPYLNTLTGTHVPVNAGQLRALIDAAEILLADPDFTEFMTQEEAEEDLEYLVYDLNNSALTFTWVQGATTYTVTVGVGVGSVYEVEFTFNRITGTVTITNAATTGYTVGDVLTADLTNLDGAGTAGFQWLRRMEYPDPAAEAEPIAGATSDTYTLAAADVDNVIYLRVRRTGFFGFVLSDPTEVVVDDTPPTTGTITITFQDWNGITPIDGPDPFSITYVSPPSITLGQASVTGITWHLRGTQVGTGDTITLDADVHGNWVGTQVLTVRGYIDGRLYSALVSFTTTL